MPMILLTSLSLYSQELNLNPIQIKQGNINYIAFDMKDSNTVLKYIQMGKLLEKDASIYAKEKTKCKNQIILFTTLGVLTGTINGILITGGYVILKNNNLL